MIASEVKQWYLLTSKPGKDALAEQQLLNQGYEVYRPIGQRLRKRRGKMVKTLESLFPRYMFIRLDSINDNWGPIRSTIGVQQFVRFGTDPAYVPDSLVELLKEREAELGNNAVDLDRYKKGEKVLITDGAFKGLQAVFCSYDGEERSIVLLNILHKETKMSISPANLSAA